MPVWLVTINEAVVSLDFWHWDQPSPWTLDCRAVGMAGEGLGLREGKVSWTLAEGSHLQCRKQPQFCHSTSG
jgi:hypothetical protein